jgi:hypothetical protein
MGLVTYFVAFPTILSIEENDGFSLAEIYRESRRVAGPILHVNSSPIGKDPEQLERILPDHHDFGPLINIIIH